MVLCPRWGELILAALPTFHCRNIASLSLLGWLRSAVLVVP